MTITRTNLGTTPYVINHRNVNQLAAVGNHRVHDPLDRKTAQYAPWGNQSNVTAVSFIDNPNGTTYYLPYSHDNIHSMELPANPGFYALFVTANLDGCWIFVEHKNNGNVVVYHANSITGVSPTVQQSATDPLFQTNAAWIRNAALYIAARAHYAATPNQALWVLRKNRYSR
jgi:hypothetical protein